MNKEEKIKIVESLKHCLTDSKNIYFTDVSGLDALQTSKLRRLCFEKNVVLSVVKNTLLKKAMDACDKDFSAFNDILKGNTTLMTSNNSSAPAKVIKFFLEKEKFNVSYKKVILKGGHVAESIYLGHDQLEVLVSLKSKEELLGDIIMLLQSPVKNLLSSLGSAKQNISSLLKTLENNPLDRGLEKKNESKTAVPEAAASEAIEEKKMESLDENNESENVDNDDSIKK